MQHNSKKIAKIVEELSMYFFSVDATEIRSSIKIEGNIATITFEANYDPKYKYKFETMERLLSTPRDEMMEDEYWQLAGSGDPGEPSQLLLVGVMVDSSTIDIDASTVKIKIRKNI